MATFLLRPQDGGRDIAIPTGKTTIGRGPFLGVTDKRVSRSHAVVELTDGKLTVLPVHANPMFYKASVKKKFVVLKRNEVQELFSGDTISLLPETLFFKVVCEGGMSNNGLTTEEAAIGADKNVHSVLFDNHEKHSTSTSTKVPTASFLDEFMDKRPSPETVSGSSSQAIKDNKDPILEFPNTQSQPSKGNICKVSSSKAEVTPAPLLQKTRKLPSWLIQSTSAEGKSPVKKGANKQGKASANTCKTEKTTATSNKSVKTVKKPASALVKQERLDSYEDSLGGDGNEGDQPLKQKGKGKSTTPMKRKSTTIPESDDDDDDITPVRHKRTKQLSSDSDEENITTQSAKKQDVSKPAEPVLQHESSGSNEDVKPVAAKKSETKTPEKDESTAPKFPLCQYGSKCYRKSLAHFKEYSHPDKDSKVDEEDSGTSDDDRPECSYGTSCYRTNPQHKQDYKHTKAPERPKREKSKHKSVLDNDSDDNGPNTYDYNDSFLDDGDVDGSESSYSAGSDDSDWNPKGDDDDDDDDDDDNEDVNELLSEARGFLRSKKMTKPV